MNAVRNTTKSGKVSIVVTFDNGTTKKVAGNRASRNNFIVVSDTAVVATRQKKADADAYAAKYGHKVLTVADTVATVSQKCGTATLDFSGEALRDAVAKSVERDRARLKAKKAPKATKADDVVPVAKKAPTKKATKKATKKVAAKKGYAPGKIVGLGSDAFPVVFVPNDDTVAVAFGKSRFLTMDWDGEKAIGDIPAKVWKSFVALRSAKAIKDGKTIYARICDWVALTLPEIAPELVGA